MRREQLERWQVGVYALAIAAGAGLGLGAPGVGALLATALWPLLASLLFVTFLQVPLADLGGALGERRSVGALLLGNFIAVPLLVWALSTFLPDDPAVRLGFFLVMLVPCTDWFTTFTHLGGGDGRLALTTTPILLFSQMLLLPLFLWIFLGPEASAGMQTAPFLQAFVGIILIPLTLALAVERVARTRQRVASALERSAWLPVPLLGVVLFVVAAAEIHGVLGSVADLAQVAGLFGIYLLTVPLVALAIARALGLRPRAARTVVFSMGTRNSFVVLPLVLAWPGAGALAASVVVLQSLVELCGMLGYLAVVPRWLRKNPGNTQRG